MTRQGQPGQEQAMGADRLHVVFGTGQVGSALAARLAGRGFAVRAVSRHRPAVLAGVDWRGADAADPEAATDAAKGAAVIYQCLNAPYNQWPERFPPLQQGVLAAAERTGALLVSLENLYGYGPTGGQPMTEDLPLAATGVKGRARAAMTAELLAATAAGRVRIAIGRASDFFGPGVTEGSTLGERVFGNALAGRRADFIGNPGLPHTYSYVPDIAAGLATLGTDPRAAGQVWHLPGPATVTTRALLDLLADQVGHRVAVRSLSKPAVRALGLVNPVLRELAETYYQFGGPFVMDTTKYRSVFGVAGTPLADAIAETLAWYRTRPGTPWHPNQRRLAPCQPRPSRAQPSGLPACRARPGLARRDDHDSGRRPHGGVPALPQHRHRRVNHLHRHRRGERRAPGPLHLAQRPRRGDHRAHPPAPRRALHHPGRPGPRHPQRPGTCGRTGRDGRRPGRRAALTAAPGGPSSPSSPMMPGITSPGCASASAADRHGDR
jgi:nucleoside-diphosphate-sugar epimerase